MSVILQAPLSYQAPLTDVQRAEIIEYTNQYRKAHQAPNLIWDDNIANYSQSWANYLITNNLFQHSGSQLYGENLAYFKGYGNDPVTLIKLSIDLWYKEIEYYNFSKPGFSSNTGHFTCLVWKNSKTFGIGIAIKDDTVVISFNTSPPGNIVGEFNTNVLPKLDDIPLPTSPPVPTPSKPIEPPPPEPTSLLPKNKLMYTINILYKIIEELKKPRLNRLMIINNIKNIIKELIHHS